MTMPYPAYRPSPSNSYPYPPNGAGPQFTPASLSSTSYTSTAYSPSAKQLDDDRRQISRTPSPTPSEVKALSDGLLNWKQLLQWRFWARKDWIKYYIIIGVIAVLTSLITIFHTQIVDELTPVTKWLHGLKYGYLVPIGVLFVISFPPLFGHEIVAILCGLVWGLWIGFAIVSAGTFIGEVGNFYAFKYCCRARGEKMEKTQIPYACLARCVRTGGFKIALIARFSAIPGHFTTAVFSTCGMNIFTFSIAAILSLPKQLITVYLGVILEQSSEGVTDKKSRYISDGVLALTLLVTVLAMWYILRQMALVKPMVIYDRRKARQGKTMLGALDGRGGVYGNPGLNDSDSSVGYDPRASLSDIPLTAKPGSGAEHQQWDAQGRAVGYTPGPVGQVMYAPQPTRANSGLSGRAGAEVSQAAEVVYAPGRAGARQETSEEVGWDMQMRERERAPQGQGQFTQSPPPMQTQQQQQTPAQQYQQQQQHQQSQHYEPETPTPTQAQYATAYGAYGHGGGHSVEPTGASYHTAYGSEDEQDEQAPVRAFSPPPPSYRTERR
ncbi:snare associated Golgi protein-domain-containing protein [Mycena metata]|uniref:Golgi apparatus membrane protein TVP38 n=1 Tax=Mycena metata TaxID=1033252 RepID=A0AAD7JJV3_9AGAR|nr:snare associated Golgi protein-domain-containing protein [Mycena metata]